MRSPYLWAWLVIALIVRVWGINFGLPFTFHPDEGQYVMEALRMGKAMTLRPWTLCNPSLYTYVLMGSLAGPTGILSLAGWPREALVASAYLISRLVSTLFGVGAVYLVYLIGSRYVSPLVGHVAALFLALNFLHARDSHFATNDIPAVTLGLLAFHLFLRASDGPPRTLFVSGLAAGLAVAMKYNLGVLIIPLAVAAMIRSRGVKPLQWAREAAAGTLGGLTGFLAGAPYALLDFSRFRQDLAGLEAVGSGPWFGQSGEAPALFYLKALLQGSGVVIVALAVAGTIWVLTCGRDRFGVLVLVFLGALAGSLALYTRAFVRFALPLLPLICLLAAVAVYRVELWCRARAAVRYLGMALIVVATLEPAAYLIWHDLVLTREDTRSEARRWASTHLPPGARIVVEAYGVPLGQEYAVSRVSALADKSLGEWRGEGAQFFVTSSFIADRFAPELLGVARPPANDRCGTFRLGNIHPEVYADLRKQARMVARFSPWPDAARQSFAIDNVYSPFWNVLSWRRPGPVITVFQLGSGSP